MINLRKIISLFICGAILMLSFPCAVMAEGRIYYVDSAGGNDNNNGLTTVGAWKSLSKVNDVQLSPGDKVYLKAGSVWNGEYLRLKGSGTAEMPIVIDMYGSGARPVINTNGASSAAVSLMYVQGYEINNLELTNYTDTALTYCRGLYAETGNTDSRSHFSFSNLYIHDVNGVLSDHMNGGIIMRGYSTDSSAAEFHDVTIENCTIENVNRNGIRIAGQSSRGSSNIIIRNNVLSKIGGDGIVTIGTNGAVIEHNIASDCFYKYAEMSGTACVAIWTYGSDNTVIQYNEAYSTHSASDGEGFDSDYNCTNSLFQYNYSHDNDGGFMLICNNPAQESNFNTGTVVRYNISRNDKSSGIMLSGNPTDAVIYNNTIYIGEGIKTNPVNTYAWNGGHASNISFYNNIFCNLGTGDFAMGATENYIFSHNLFYGGSSEKQPEDSGKVTGDPCFVLAAGGTPDGYKLSGESPCIDMGKNIADNGGQDYFGNIISDGMTDIGAAEYFGVKPSPKPTPEVETEPMYTAEYEGVLFKTDLEKYDNIEDMDITPVSGSWTVEQGSEGRKCLKGILSDTGAAGILIGNDDWSDYTVDVSYKLIQSDEFALSTADADKNVITSTIYTRSGDILDSGNFVKYMFRNPAYYNNYFGGYSKNGSAKLGIIDNNFYSGTNSAAALVRNRIQRVTVSEKNNAGTGGATIYHFVSFSNGIGDTYTAQKNEWAGNGSGILSGKIGIEFKNAVSEGITPMYAEIYSIKITGTKTFSVSYTDGAENISEIPADSEIVVHGNMGGCVLNGTYYESPAVVTAVYNNGVLFDLNIQQTQNGIFQYKVNTPADTSGCTIKTFVWNSLENLKPVIPPAVM